MLHGRLGDHDLARLEEVRPEVILFSGGTDGGQEGIVLDNARVLAARLVRAHFVVACNSAVAAQVAKLLGRHGAAVDVVANVMPEIGELDIEPARAAISEAFVRHVIRGKGLSGVAEFAEQVVMPTPEAVLRATRLLAGEVGDVLVVDIGGATTDVHSATDTSEPGPGIAGPLLPVLPVLRSVQGDLGMRSNAPSALTTDSEWLLQRLGLDDTEARAAAARRAAQPDFVPHSDEERSVDRALAVSCVHRALRRHCGRLRIAASPHQPVRISADGPDLRVASLIVGTGGILARTTDGEGILDEALARCDDRSLVPRAPRLAVDTGYVLAAVGLLAGVDRRAAKWLALPLVAR